MASNSDKNPGGQDERDSDDDYDTVDGPCHPRTSTVVPTSDITYRKDTCKTRELPGRSKRARLVDETDGTAADHVESREMIVYSDGEDERPEDDHQGGCSCQGTGSCVENSLNNTRVEQSDNIRTATVTRTGVELIQKHVVVAGRNVYTHTAKDLFSIINKNRGSLSSSWMVNQAPLTFLHAAVIHRRPEIIPVLVDSGLLLDLLDCVVNDPDSNYATYKAMEIAELQKNDKMIRLLNEQKRFAESFGWMHKCARSGNLPAVKWLVEKHPELLNKPMTQTAQSSSPSPVQRHTGTEPIYWAVTSGSVPLVDFMLSKGANVHSTSSEGETLLSRAVSLGHTELVLYLVEKQHMDTNEPGYEQKMPLQRAVANRDVGMIKLLLQLDAQIPDTLLNDVAKAGHVQIFMVLKDHFHNLDLQDEMGKFPLYYALQNDNLQMAEELIKSGAKLHLRDRQRRNLLHLAVSRNNQETFDFVVRHMKQKKNSRKKPVLGELMNQRDRYVGAERCFLVRGKDQGQDAYHYVDVNRYCMSAFRQMTRAGTAIDVVKYGSVIISGWGSSVSSEIADSIEKRHDIKKITDTTAEDFTPLNLAIIKENYDMALALIDLGADVNIPDSFGLTPLHMACMQGSLKVVTRLEKAKARLNAVDHDGHHPLHLAIENQHAHVVNFLKAPSFTNLAELGRFRRLLAEYSAKVSNAKLQEARGEGKDIKQQLVDDLRMLKADISSLSTVLGKGPIMQESCHPDSEIMTETRYASQH